MKLLTDRDDIATLIEEWAVQSDGYIDQILVNSVRGVAYGLVVPAQQKHPTVLKIFLRDTGEQKEIPAPDNAFFSYLTEHPQLQIAVVVSFSQPVDNRYDWHFGIDENRLMLFRDCPAY